jgi:YVTN family beta-propeller protein
MRLGVLFMMVVASLAACSSEPTGPRLYVTNEISGDLSVIDLRTSSVVATIPVGKRPRGVRVSPDRTTLYVALSGSPIAGPGVDESTLPPPDRRSDGIGVIDVRSGKLLKTLAAGSDPEQLAVSTDGRRLFVANEDAGEVSVVDVASASVIRRIAVGGEPEGVDLSPDGRWVYVTSEEDNQVAVIDTESLALAATLPVGARPRSTAFMPDGSRAFVTAENDAAIYAIDSIQHRVIGPIKISGTNARPMGIVAAPDGRHVYVSTGRAKMAAIVETLTTAHVASVEVGERPWGIAVSRDGKSLYTANGPSNDVSIVDLASRAVIARVKVGRQPWGLAIVP